MHDLIRSINVGSIEWKFNLSSMFDLLVAIKCCAVVAILKMNTIGFGFTIMRMNWFKLERRKRPNKRFQIERLIEKGFETKSILFDSKWKRGLIQLFSKNEKTRRHLFFRGLFSSRFLFLAGLRVIIHECYVPYGIFRFVKSYPYILLDVAETKEDPFFINNNIACRTSSQNSYTYFVRSYISNPITTVCTVFVLPMHLCTLLPFLLQWSPQILILSVTIN